MATFKGKGVELQIDPKELEMILKTIKDMFQEFLDTVENIVAIVADLAKEFLGQAGEEFNKRIQGYDNDFKEVSTTLDNFGNAVSDYQKELLALEEELAAEASKLSIGK